MINIVAYFQAFSLKIYGRDILIITKIEKLKINLKDHMCLQRDLSQIGTLG